MRDLVKRADAFAAMAHGLMNQLLKENEAILCALEGGDETLLRRAWMAVENGWRTLCV